MSNSSSILIRGPEEGDEAFIFQSWLKGYQFGNPMNRGLDIQTFQIGYRPVIEKLLKRSTVKVACPDYDPSLIFGYSVYEGNRLHWIFVKSHYRGEKLASKLLPKDFKSVSHKTLVGEQILKKKFPNIKYEPFL